MDRVVAFRLALLDAALAHIIVLILRFNAQLVLLSTPLIKQQSPVFLQIALQINSSALPEYVLIV